MAAIKLTMKLLIDKKANRVLFAEANKDFVDFLFSLLSLPVGSVIKLLTNGNMVGCIGNLYESVKTLNDTYMLQPAKNKELLLNPKVAVASPINVLLLGSNESTENVSTYYTCRSGYLHCCVSTDPTVICPTQNCGYNMSTPLTFVPSAAKATTPCSSGQKGYVKEVVTYMVMDDLTVTPMSTISGITLLSKFNIANVNLLEEKVVDLGMEEGLQLLKTSLQSKTALSGVFLGKKSI